MQHPLCSIAVSCGGGRSSAAAVQRLQEALRSRDLAAALSALNDCDACEGEPETSPHVTQDDLNRLLDMVCMKPEGTAEHITRLLTRHPTAADPNCMLAAHGCRPVHLLASRGRHTLLRALLAHPSCNTESLSQYGETGLHCAVGTADVTEADVLECVKILVEKNLYVDERDNNGRTAALQAAKYGLISVVQYLMDSREVNIDIPFRDETAREVLARSHPSLVQNYPKKPPPPLDFKTHYFSLIADKKEAEFISSLENNRSVYVTNGQHTLLQACVRQGLNKAAKKLIDMGADVNATSGELRPPVILAVDYGHEKIVKYLTENESTVLTVLDSPTYKQTVLHIAVTSVRCTAPCLELLLQSLSKREIISELINAQDYRQNTALHYAACNNKTAYIILLLEYNANIFILNNKYRPAFLDINPKYINDYLDERISSEDGTEKNVEPERDFDLVFDYSFLILPGAEESTSRDMECLDMLASSVYHRPLLKHPIIRGFLHVKWHRVYWLFYINFLTYLLFATFLSVHIYNVPYAHGYNSSDIVENSNDNDEGVILEFSRWITLILILPLALLKGTHMNLKTFGTLWQDLIEWSLLIITLVVLILPNSWYRVHQPACAVAVLLAYTELVFLLGCHPSQATNVAMFFTVCRSFLSLLLWCSFLIIAFAFSFFIIFRRCSPSCEDKFFTEPGTSFLRTIVMMSGEFNIGEMHFELFSVISHIIFVLFLFFIATVLVNLLNGLAVSDTQIIKDEAQVVCCEAQVRMYAKFETRWGSCTHAPCVWLAPQLQLLPELPEGKLRVQLDGNSMLPELRHAWCAPRSRGGTCCLPGGYRCCRGFDEIVTEARAVATQRGQEGDVSKLVARLDRIEALLLDKKQL